MVDAEISQQQVLEFEFPWNSNPEMDFDHFGKDCDHSTDTKFLLRHGLDNGLSAMDAWNPHAGLAYRPPTRMPISMLSASS